jgi:hypothetical protein
MQSLPPSPSPVAHALEQYKFRTHFKAHVLDVDEKKRRRGLFTVVFVHSDDTMPMVSVHYVHSEDCDRDEYASAFIQSQPLLRQWLSTYDPAKEFLIAAALTVWQASSEQQAGQVAQSAKLTFEQLAELDRDAFEAQQKRLESGAVAPSRKKCKGKKSRNQKALAPTEVACTDLVPQPPQ